MKISRQRRDRQENERPRPPPQQRLLGGAGEWIAPPLPHQRLLGGAGSLGPLFLLLASITRWELCLLGRGDRRSQAGLILTLSTLADVQGIMRIYQPWATGEMDEPR